MKLRQTFSAIPPLRREWQALQWGVIWLPINPILALLGLVFALVGTWKSRFQQVSSDALAKGFGLLSLWLIFTAIVAHSRGEALLGLANFLPYFTVFLAYRLILRHFSHLKSLAWLLSVSALLLVILGLGQIYGGWASSPWLRAMSTNLVAGGHPAGRMSSLLTYANIFSAYLLMVFPLSLGLLIERVRQWRRHPQRFPIWVIALLALICIGQAIALGLTESRSAWAIAFLICLSYALYLSWYPLIALGSFLAGIVLWSAFGPVGKEPLRQIVPRYLWARLSDELYPDRYRTAMRSTQWEFAWNMSLARPGTGWGLRNFTPLYKAEMNVWLGHPHSFPLMLLAETGIPGTLLFLGLVAWILYHATQLCLKLARRSQHQRYQQAHLLLLSYLIAFGSVTLYNLSDVTVFDLRVNLLGWILLAAIAGVSQPIKGNNRQISLEIARP